MNVNPATESPKDNAPQSIPSIPVNPPTTRSQSFDAEDSTAYKTESKSYNVNIFIYKRKKTNKYIIKSNIFSKIYNNLI